jgi:Uma2 family endonuclease
MVLQISPLKNEPIITWEALPDNFLLPNEPVENIQQPNLAAALTDALGAAGLIQPEMLIGSNLGLVASINNRTVVKAPDWFYVPNAVSKEARRSYTPSLEGDPVAIAMEFISETEGGEFSIRSTHPYGKLYFYEQILQVPTYVIYDPYVPSLEVRYLQNGHYVLQEANTQGQVWIPELELFLGICSGTRLGQSMNWLRWYDRSGKLLLWSSEKAQILAAKLRELGIDPDALT